MVFTQEGEYDSSSQEGRQVYNNEARKKLPVIVLTGYLGAGKTTLLNYILKEQHDKKLAVIENEVGEVSIDDALVQQQSQSPEQEIILLGNGCICCTIRGDLVDTLKSIAEQHNDGMPLDGVIIELTGVADPAPVVQTFIVVPEVCDAFYVDNVVALVDAKHAIDRLDESRQTSWEMGTASAQIAFSSTVLLNKVDLADEALLTEIERQILKINSTVTIIRCEHARVAVSKLFNVGIFDLRRVLEEQYMDESEFTSFYKPQMDSSVSNVGIRCCGAVNLFEVERFLDKYLDDEETAKDFLRVKAVLDVSGSDRKYVIQCVHMTRNCGFVDYWSAEELRENRMIFIGRHMQERRKDLQECFQSCITKPLRFEVGTQVQVKVGGGAHHHHHDDEHGEHGHAVEPCSLQGMSISVVRMPPGKIGCTILADGVIDRVVEGGLAFLAGLQVGWQIAHIDEFPFSLEVFDRKVVGGVAYSLICTTGIGHFRWERGCILKQWDQCNAYRVKLNIGVEVLIPVDDDCDIEAF